MKQIPVFWKTTLNDIEDAVNKVQKGKAVSLKVSAGGRPIYLIHYGKKNVFHRTANLSSALGAKARRCYADKEQEGYAPTVFLAGCIHGGEFEGTAGILNLMQILETGKDYAGKEYPEILELSKKVNILLVPCANPDGRSRIAFPTMVGRSFEELRYYNQGTWKDGSLCGYPACKMYHPIKEYADLLGAYFNDNGVNMMHDDFFGHKANETQNMFDIVDEYVPDFTVLLHGGTNCTNLMLKPAYAPEQVKGFVLGVEERIKARCEESGIAYKIVPGDCGENRVSPTSFNLPSALYHMSGEPCVTFESNQGLTEDPYNMSALTHEEIYESHMILFEEVLRSVIRKG